MAYVFISESSRRPQFISEEQLENRWEAAFGKKRPEVVCKGCGEKKGTLIDGLCKECRSKPYSAFWNNLS